MSGPVYDAKSKVLSFCSISRVHDRIWDWLAALISVSSILQIQYAHFNGEDLLKLLGGELAYSEHPSSGLRSEPDELVNSIIPLLQNSGREPSQWTENEFQKVVDDFAKMYPSIKSTHGPNGMTIEFPYGNFTSLCQFDSNESHPQLGNGLCILQRFPVGFKSDAEGILTALDLNKAFLQDRPAGYGFGSFCYDKGDICFNGFIPNFAYRGGLLLNFLFACAERAQALEAVFTAND